ncbi:MAG: TolC family protein [Myxococcota bacterium]
MWLSILLIAAPPLEIDLGAAIERALDSPELRGLAEAVEERGRLDGEIGGTWGPLEFSVAPGARYGAADRGPELVARIDQPVHLGGIAGARRAAATAERAEMRAAQGLERLERSLDTARAWTKLWWLQRAAREAEDDVALAGRLIDHLRRQRAHAELTAQELAEGEAFLAEAQARSIDLEGLRYEAMLRLGERIGAEPSDLLRAGAPQIQAGSSTTGPGVGPEVRRVQAELQAASAREEEIRAAERPTFLAGLSWTREAGGSQVALLSLGLRAPLWDQDERGQAKALAERLSLRARLGATERHARYRLALAVHEVEHAEELEGVLRGALVTATDRAVEATARAQEAQAATVLELLWAKRRAIAARRTWLEQLGEVHFARAQLSILTRATESQP